MSNSNKYQSDQTNIKILNKLKILIVSFLISLSILYFVALPIYKEIRVKKVSIDLLTDSIDQREKAIVNLNDLSVQNRDIRDEELLKIKNLLLKENSIELYIANINQISKLPESYLKIISMSVGTVNQINSKKSDLTKETISLSVTGKYDNLIVFIEKMENIIPLINIESLNVKNNNQVNNETEIVSNSIPEIDITADMVLSFYHQ